MQLLAPSGRTQSSWSCRLSGLEGFRLHASRRDIQPNQDQDDSYPDTTLLNRMMPVQRPGGSSDHERQNPQPCQPISRVHGMSGGGRAIYRLIQLYQPFPPVFAWIQTTFKPLEFRPLDVRKRWLNMSPIEASVMKSFPGFKGRSAEPREKDPVKEDDQRKGWTDVDDDGKYHYQESFTVPIIFMHREPDSGAETKC